MAYKKSNPNGQATMANSEPVVIASDQSAVPVSGTVTANIGTVATLATAAKQDTGNTSLSSVDGKLVTAKTADFDTGAGTDTVQMVGIALPKSGGAVAGGTSSDPVRIDPTGTTTQPVSLASVPSHAVTNAGTFAVQATEADGANTTLGAKADAKSTATDTTAVSAMSVLKQISASVQAPPSQAVTNAGTFAVQATVAASATNIAKAEDVASADADVGVPAMAVRKATPANTSGTDGDYEMLQMSAGRLWVDASGKTLTVDGSGVTQPVSGTVSANPGTATNWGVYVEDAAETAGGNLSMVGSVRRDTPAASSGTSGDNSTINTGKNGGLWVSQSAEPQGGVSVATGSVGATKTDIGTANTAGSVYGWYFYNPNSSVAYVQFFNTQASGVTLGTTAPVYSLGIPATSAANLMCPLPIAHSTAICIAITTTRAGSTGPSSTVDYNILYKQ
ncbi:MAG: hypothetical protein ACLGJB_03725 [Blastocatellia bacterium]